MRHKEHLNIMYSRNIARSRVFIFQWITINFIGYIVGLIAAIILSFTIVNFFHPEETNLIVGLGIGSGIGFFQWKSLKNLFNVSIYWMLASAFGIGIPYGVLVILQEQDIVLPLLLGHEIVFPVLCFTLSGLIVGLMQMKLLSSYVSRTYWWVIVSTLAWGISLSLNSIFFSGIIMGVITLAALVWGFKPKT